MSIARLTLPSRLELKRPDGSAKEAPLAKVSFTTALYVSPVQMIPACSHTGTPRHFHSSTTSGQASLMRLRTLASVTPRQSPSSLILASISREGEPPPCRSFEPLLPFMVVSLSFWFLSLARRPGTNLQRRDRLHFEQIIRVRQPAVNQQRIRRIGVARKHLWKFSAAIGAKRGRILGARQVAGELHHVLPVGADRAQRGVDVGVDLRALRLD